MFCLQKKRYENILTSALKTTEYLEVSESIKVVYNRHCIGKLKIKTVHIVLFPHIHQLLATTHRNCINVNLYHLMLYVRDDATRHKYQFYRVIKAHHMIVN